MKLIAVGMLVMLALVALDGATPIDVVGEAEAMQCFPDSDIDPCPAVCWVGEQFGWHCID